MSDWGVYGVGVSRWFAQEEREQYARAGQHGNAEEQVRVGGGEYLVPAAGYRAAREADSAPNPVETALAGLLSCQVVSYRFWSAKLNIGRSARPVADRGR